MSENSLSSAMARTVKTLRTEHGWSLDQLAARSGVSKGVLVALEQGRSNPNLTTLARLSDAFGVPATLLVDVSAPAVRVGDASRVLWQGESGGSGTILGATDPPWGAELWHWEVMPGETFGGEAHVPGTRELAWVESGVLTVTVAGEAYQVSPGQCARFPGSLHHRYSNTSDQPVRFTMVVVIPPAQDLKAGHVRRTAPGPARPTGVTRCAESSPWRRRRNRVRRPCRDLAPGRSRPPWPAPRAARCSP
jgi:transcriptional regulator with XRE-family HTH domain